MPELKWIGKDAIVNHHREVPYRLLHCDSELSAGNADSGNLLVQGDNLEALKALLPYYAGKVKCIYIDPPYNTGNENWVYNDNVNSGEIKQWLGKVVGKEAEDLSRHDKWLCMMYPRLRLLREFLKEDGVIFVSIDDNENHHLRAVMNEIFGSNCFVADIIWRSADSSNNDAKKVSMDHNYTIAYSKRPDWISFALPRSEENNAHYSNPDDDPNGPWFAGNLSSPNPRENLRYQISHPDGRALEPPANGWRWSKQQVEEKIASGEIVFTDTSRGILRKTYLKDQKGLAPSSLWVDIDETGHNRNAKYELKNIFPEVPTSELFPTPKPTKFVEKILRIATKADDLVMDTFSGSGTTGHAVLNLNKQDGGNRQFILVEMDEKIASEITGERLRRVVNGYDKGGDSVKPVEGLGGGFRYCRLGTPLFDEFGDIDGAVSFPDLAAHVFFSETGAPIPQRVDGSTPLVGQHGAQIVYLLYSEPEQGFARIEAGNVLTPDMLTNLPAAPDGFVGERVVYAEGCTVSADRLKAEGIVFKQIPYSIQGA
ncbi:site-specific DNA-methyltransferase [Shimia sp. R10_1]|uniref:site-specific DNA-methyltransferase n=1 Tax=Shimia sp. R10_1 TaxID=2821095 RepID=UPI001AD9DFBB|nr:site-specific DNA-methyltransferase [Shimia sp. R10_1]MBO9474009.1 site-specific DNA-methyltransferase [Shimia sp. R10_1]